MLCCYIRMSKILMVVIVFFKCVLNNSTFLGCATTYHCLDFWSVKIFLLPHVVDICNCSV